MNRTKILCCIAGCLLLVGAGCQKKAKVQLTQEMVVRQYQEAQVISGRETSVEIPNSIVAKNVALTVPADWSGEGLMWRPKESSKSFIRLSVFDDGYAEGQWSLQKSQDVHQVMGFEKTDKGYLLIVHHLGLKAILVKMFIPNKEGANGYLFGECRIMDEQENDSSLWNACKTALESIH